MPVPETYDDSDFSSLSWHDCRLYRIDVPDEKSSFVLDIDYIFEWEKSGDSFLAVWASPCRLVFEGVNYCLLYTSPSPRDKRQSRMPSSA